MTVEIRELVIKATVSDGKDNKNEVQSGDKVDTQGIVNLCVTEVLKILKREKER
jgi:hypothetical protein